MSRTSKMLQFVNWRMKVTISDTRTLVGTLMAFDRHMNIVLGDCEEYRRIRGKKASEEKEEKRMLGMVMLRGENVISMAAEAPPLQRAKPKGAGRGGPGAGRAAGRGMPVAPLSAAPKGLTGPVKGVGGPGAAQMMPQASMSGAAVTYGRGVPAGVRPPGPPGMPGMPPMAPPRPGMPPMFGGPPAPNMGRGGMPPGPPQPGAGGPGGPPRPMFNAPPPGMPGMPPRPGGPPMGVPPMAGRGMGFPPQMGGPPRPPFPPGPPRP